MLFNSYAFVFAFLPLMLAAFWGLAKLKRPTLALAALTVGSLLFYAYWDARYLPLMLGSIGVNFLVGSSLSAFAGSRAGRWVLGAGVAANLALLGYFKYANFFLNSANKLVNTGLTLPEIALPLGISFFTFTQIAYLVDAYRGETKKHNFLTYCLFVTFFPHLIAGPILHHRDVIPQFHRLRTFVFSHRNVAFGLALFAIGLAKKLLIADNLAPMANAAFSHPAHLGFYEAWAGALAYTFQLYFDFSGYSDMAVGLALLFNIRLPFNFDSPYKSTSIVDFWRRWHMTLSRFLRDYLYIPLGGNRHGEARRHINLALTMLLGGLWHGAGWTFVIWGGLHGTYLVVNHLWRKLGRPLPGLVGWGLTFLAVVVGWVFFRAPGVGHAVDMLQAMAGLNGLAPRPTALGWGHLAAFAVLLGVVAKAPNSQQLVMRMKPGLALGLLAGVLTVAALMTMNEISEFLYFQF